MGDGQKTPLALNQFERMLFLGIRAREREVEREILSQLRKDTTDTLKLITDRLELPEGSIGSPPHLLNYNAPSSMLDGALYITEQCS